MTKSTDPQNTVDTGLGNLISGIAQIIEQARGQVRQSVNAAMVQSYWQIGHLIVEHEQQGEARAAYGKQKLQQLSQQLTGRFGKGFDVGNLRNTRQFYLTFLIHDAVRSELNWTHYRVLMRVENPLAREWYLNEVLQQSWSAKALQVLNDQGIK